MDEFLKKINLKTLKNKKRIRKNEIKIMNCKKKNKRTKRRMKTNDLKDK